MARTKSMEQIKINESGTSGTIKEKQQRLYYIKLMMNNLILNWLFTM